MDGVDILRGVSILSVILLHFWIRMHDGKVSLLQFPWMPERLFDFLFRNGDEGVTVFFAISGFLITLTSLRRFGSLGAMQPGRFYRIRFARIAPLLLLELAVLSVLHLARVPGFVIPAKVATLPRALFAALTFHLNWLEGMHGYLAANWDVLWSLSVEEMFYLFFPLVCVALLHRRRGRPVFIALLLAFVAMGPFARTIWTAGHPIWREKSYLGGMDAIALGCLTALLADWLWRRGSGRQTLALAVALQVVGAAMMLLIAVWPPWHFMRFIAHTGLYNTVLPVGTCLVMLGAGLHGAGPHSAKGSLWTAPVRWFGRHSYEVYLTHEFLVIGFTALYFKWHRGPLGLWLAALLLGCAVLGWVTARFFSEPMNRRLRGAAPPK
ncbi:acyltransferase family protein [Granulicella sp. 5B5]|nr:acyltransferase family protein [Granulicella sp. 5B5]